MYRLIHPRSFVSLLSDSNQRPRDYKSRALCCGQALEDSKGADRIGLTRFAAAKVVLFVHLSKRMRHFFACFYIFVP